MNYCHEICELLEIRGLQNPQQPPPLATGLLCDDGDGRKRIFLDRNTAENNQQSIAEKKAASVRLFRN